jgi:hypothetical protein
MSPGESVSTSRLPDLISLISTSDLALFARRNSFGDSTEFLDPSRGFRLCAFRAQFQAPDGRLFSHLLLHRDTVSRLAGLRWTAPTPPSAPSRDEGPQERSSTRRTASASPRSGARPWGRGGPLSSREMDPVVAGCPAAPRRRPTRPAPGPASRPSCECAAGRLRQDRASLGARGDRAAGRGRTRFGPRSHRPACGPSRRSKLPRHSHAALGEIMPDQTRRREGGATPLGVRPTVSLIVASGNLPVDRGSAWSDSSSARVKTRGRPPASSSPDPWR